MDFSNKNISPAELPTIEEVSFHSLEEEYLVTERISFAITIAVLLVIALPFFYFIDILQDPFIIIAALTVFLLFAGLSWFATGLDFRYSGYALREKDLLFRTGWFIRKTKVVLISRIQHVSVQSGPIERKFGLSSISIFTAGASQADFTISGIKEETALNIKEWLSNQQNGSVGE